jgi:anti-sigma factor RsiW
MDNHELNRLKDTLARRPLTPQESDRVSRHLREQPGVRADWEAESNLTRLLAQLGDVPLASNFTARVLQAIEAPAARRPRYFWRWLGFGRPAIQFAGLAVCGMILFSGFSLRRWIGRTQMASSVANVVRSVEAASSLAQLPPVEVLQDFEAIHRLSRSPVRADLELLDALAVN